MNLTAFLLILVSVFMHAAWNFLGKKESPSSAFFFIAAVAGAIFCLPFVFFSGVEFSSIPAKFWYILIFSAGFNLVYFFSLAAGYRSGDISLVYPLGRSLPVILTAAVTMLLKIGGKPLSANALAGMAILFVGCVILPLQKWSDFKLKTYFSKVIFWVLLISFGATGYTILDSMDMEILKTLHFNNGVLRAIFFMCAAEVFISCGMFLIVLASRREREELKRIARSWTPYVAGVFTALAYILVLLAMNQVTNVCYIQAFRQMSLPLGMLAGVFILKESCSMPKIIGIILIVTGLVMTSF